MYYGNEEDLDSAPLNMMDFTYPDGCRYEGETVVQRTGSKVRHGNGCMYDKAGRLTFNGYWRNDKR